MTASTKQTLVAVATMAAVTAVTVALINGKVPFVPAVVSTKLRGLVGAA